MLVSDEYRYGMFVSYLEQCHVGLENVEICDFITKADFARILYHLSGNTTESDSNEEMEFVGWAEAGDILTNPLPENMGQALTREEAITMLYRYSLDHTLYAYDQAVYADASTYSDSDDISAWAKTAVNMLSKAGVLEKENESLNPKENLSYGEAAKLVATFKLLNDRPTIIQKDGPSLSYLPIGDIDVTDISSDEVLEEDSIAFAFGHSSGLNTIGAVPELTIPRFNDNDLQWANSNHSSMLSRSFNILAKDNVDGKLPRRVSNLSTSVGALISGSNGKLSLNAQRFISEGSEDPDFRETNDAMRRHYYKYDPAGGVGTTKGGIHTDSAYHWFNNHYYNAKCEYAAGNFPTAYVELGRSIHYLEDINAPHHANRKYISNSNHSEYEAWVKNNFYTNYWEWGTAQSSYPFVCNSSFLLMSNNFSKAACDLYEQCQNYESNPTVARAATAQLTTRAQRAMAGLLYRFLVDTNRAN